MGKVAFHCDCGERLTAEEQCGTVTCAQCQRSVSVPGGGDNRLATRTPLDLSAALSGTARVRGERARDPRRPARSSRRTAVASSPKGLHAWGLVGLAAAVAIAGVVVAARSAVAPGPVVAPVAESPLPDAAVTPLAVARFCDELPERERLSKVEGNARRALEDQVRTRARAHFAATGMARLELDTLVDKHLRTWVSLGVAGSD